MDDLIAIEKRDTFLMVRMNRPEKKNAMNRAARRALLDAFAFAQNRYKVVVLTGTGESFCSGVDLKEFREEAAADRSPESGGDWLEVNIAIREHPAVFIAAVNGIALGGGATLISVCDLAVAANEAEIGLPEIGFGAYPQFSGPGVQMRLAGKRAAWMVLTGERIDGATAESWGLVNRSVPRAELMREAERIAGHISRFDAVALAHSKRALDVVPGRLSEWRAAFEYGLGVNQQIRNSGGSREEKLRGVAVGVLNPGQGGVRSS
jgi:enoyl-CoA hydratase/carnithine racemase